MKQYDVIALGELLIDFTDYGKSEQGNPVFEANPGGAPCNVLALLKKLMLSLIFFCSAAAAFPLCRSNSSRKNTMFSNTWLKAFSS